MSAVASFFLLLCISLAVILATLFAFPLLEAFWRYLCELFHLMVDPGPEPQPDSLSPSEMLEILEQPLQSPRPRNHSSPTASGAEPPAGPLEHEQLWREVQRLTGP